MAAWLAILCLGMAAGRLARARGGAASAQNEGLTGSLLVAGLVLLGVAWQSAASTGLPFARIAAAWQALRG